MDVPPPRDNLTDSRLLVHAVQSRDRRALEDLLLRHLPMLQGWLRLRMSAKLRARETPADLVQSVAREALEELDRFQWRGEAAFRHWLFTRATNKLMEHARYVGAQRRDPAQEQPLDPTVSHALLECYHTICTPSRDAVAAEELARIEGAFEQLPEDYREAITLKRLCGMDYPEIAEQMGRSEGAVRNLVYRGLSRLSSILRGNLPPT